MRPRKLATASFTWGSIDATIALVAQIGLVFGTQPEQEPKKSCADENVHREMNTEQVAFQEALPILH